MIHRLFLVYQPGDEQHEEAFLDHKLSCWYVKDRHGKQIRLDPDETKAFEKWRKLVDLSNYKHSKTSVEALCEGWLDENEHKLDPERYAKHVYLLQSFAEFVGISRFGPVLLREIREKWIKTGASYG